MNLDYIALQHRAAIACPDGASRAHPRSLDPLVPVSVGRHMPAHLQGLGAAAACSWTALGHAAAHAMTRAANLGLVEAKADRSATFTATYSRLEILPCAGPVVEGGAMAPAQSQSTSSMVLRGERHVARVETLAYNIPQTSQAR